MHNADHKICDTYFILQEFHIKVNYRPDDLTQNGCQHFER